MSLDARLLESQPDQLPLFAPLGGGARRPFRRGRQQRAATAAARSGGSTSAIMELVFTRHSADTSCLLLPMLARLSHTSDRWITWITNRPLDTSELHEHGVHCGKLRVVYVRSDEDVRWILWEALENGASDTVVASVEQTSSEDIEHLERAARLGQSKGVLVRYR